MTPKEKEILLTMLEELSDRFSNDGCNDYFLPNTEENRNFLLSVAKSNENEFSDDIAYLETTTDKFLLAPGGNGTVLYYLQQLVKREL